MNDSSESKKPPDTSSNENNYFKRNDNTANNEIETDQIDNDSNKNDNLTSNELKTDQIDDNNNINYNDDANIGGVEIIKFGKEITDENNANYQIKDNINSNDNNENLNRINEDSNNNDNDANNNENFNQLNNNNKSDTKPNNNDNLDQSNNNKSDTSANNNDNFEQSSNNNNNNDNDENNNENFNQLNNNNNKSDTSANNNDNSDQSSNNNNNNDNDANNNENFDQLHNSNNNNLDTASEDKKNDQTCSTAIKTYTFDKDANLELVKLVDVEKGDIIGQGNFGEVFKVSVRNNVNYILAAKVFYMDYADYSRESRKKIYEHMSIVKQLKFPSILRFHDYSTTGFGNEHRQTVLNSFCKNESLEKNLNNDKFTFTKKMINIFGVASAMNYLHKHNIFHYDLKTSTILEDDFFYPKLSDIGYSKCFQGLKSMAKIKEFSHYIAPEVLIKDEFTQKSEVYSFGLIIYEIMTKTNPYQGKSQFQLLSVICDEELEIPDTVPSSVSDIIRRCMTKEPESRPTFEDVCKMLRNVSEFEDIEDPEEYKQYIVFIDNFIYDNNSFEQEIKKETIEIPEEEKKKKTLKKTKKGKSKKTKK